LDSKTNLEHLIDSLKRWHRSLEESFSKENLYSSDLVKRYNKLNFEVKETISSSNKIKIRSLTQSFVHLEHQIRKDNPEYITSNFLYLRFIAEDKFLDQQRSRKLIEEGQQALDKEQFLVLKAIVNALYQLLPRTQKPNLESGKSTGIS